MTPHVIAPQHPKAILVVVHGMAEHKQRYFPFLTWLSEMGFACIMADLRGHGRDCPSEELGYFGKKGDRLLVEDTLETIQWAKSQYPELKLFLMGHSMGSLIVRCFAKKYDTLIDGLIVCGSPSKNPASGVAKLLCKAISLFKGSHYRPELLEKLSTGAYQKKFASEGLTNAWLSVNKANVQAYNNDPLCGFRFTANGYEGLMGLMEETYDPDDWAVAHPSLPVHFIAGSEDPCIGSVAKFSQAVSFFRSRGYQTVTSTIYPGMRHEILNENGKEQVWRDVCDILNSWV